MAARRGSRRAQSAMEYLSTYGWAILVIAVVMLILYNMGILNPYFLTPKAQPGSCYVFRPGGQGSILSISLSGTCNNEIPEYAGRGNGYGSNAVSVATPPNLYQFTFVGWISNNHPQSGKSGDAVVLQDSCGLYLGGSTTSYSMSMDTCDCKYVSSGSTLGCGTQGTVSSLNYGAWYMLAITVNSLGYETSYAYTGSGVTGPASTATYNFGSAIYVPSGNVVIGSWLPYSTYPLNGSIANVQIYNKSLSVSDLTALYKEGVGGEPLVLQNLVGWWPLDGTLLDYSGNGYNVTPVNIVFSNAWYSGYSKP